MKFIAKLLTSILAVSLLGACAEFGEAPRYSSGAEVEKRNKVEMVRMPYLVLAESDGSAAVSDETRKGIHRFMAEIDLRFGDVLVADRGDSVSEDRVKSLAAEFRRAGIRVGETDGVFGPAPAGGNVMLYIERYIVEVPDCQDFSQPSRPDYRNTASPYYGCATTTALGLMVADPRSLIDGESDRNSTVEPQIEAAATLRGVGDDNN